MTTSSQIQLLALLAGGCLALSGCSSSGDAKSGGAVSTADFRATPPPAATAETPTSQSPAPSPQSPTPPSRTTVISPATAREGLNDVAVIVGSPAAQPLPAAKPDAHTVLVDSLVGQINGKPVFAQAFLSALDARLRAQVREARSPQDWIRFTRDLIKNELQRQLNNELFLSEARSMLTPQERQGLVHFLSRIRESLASERGVGSVEYADERLQAEEGKSLEQMATDERDAMLIRTLINRNINPRVNVSWRDVRREYERRISQYVLPSTAVLRSIRVPADQAERIEKVKAALASGQPFLEVVTSDLNDPTFAKKDEPTRVRFEGEYAKANFHSDAAVNEAVRRLKPGDFAGPFPTSGNNLTWVGLEKIEQPPVRTLADAQLEIYSALRSERFAYEAGRYFERLSQKATSTDIDLMTERLVFIALDRYMPGRVAPTPANPKPPATTPAQPSPPPPKG